MQNNQGLPFLIVAESAWGLAARLTSAQVDAYISDRKSRGFNAAMLMLMCKHAQIQSGSSTAVETGTAPFSGTALVPANIVASYWSWVDTVIQKFADNQMLVLATPCYSGNSGPTTNEGWWPDLTSNTVANNWGQWVGNRYKNYPNIIWVGGGDYTPANGTEDTLSENVQTGLVTAGATQLQTYHCQRHTYAFNHWGTAKTWLKINSLYTADGESEGFGPIFGEALNQYNYEGGPFPFHAIENWYEGEHSMTSTNVAVESWQAFLAGACGVTFGNGTIWPFNTGFASEYSSNGSKGHGAIGVLSASYPWQTLVPKRDATLVSSTRGTGLSEISPALGTLDGGAGKFAFILVPTATSPTVVMTNFTQSSVRARWYDPFANSFTTASGSPFGNTGSQSVTHPGNNSIGTSAWVLVMDAA